MIGRIIEFSVNNKFLVMLLTGVLVLGGLYSIYTIRLDAIPDLSDVQVIFFTEYPGQSPRVVEDQVTYPLATTMLAVPYAKVVRGTSMFGYLAAKLRAKCPGRPTTEQHGPNPVTHLLPVNDR